MRSIIHDQVSGTFIEGPMQSQPENNNDQQGGGENPPNSSEQAQEKVFQGNADDKDIPFYEIIQSYD